MTAEKPRLHLDADTSIRSLYHALHERGHDVTRTPNEWMPHHADDEAQLLGATAQGRLIFTFNIRDFIPLAGRHPGHGGILLAPQRSFSLIDLIHALDRCLTETQSGDWKRQVHWLADWRA